MLEKGSRSTIVTRLAAYGRLVCAIVFAFGLVFFAPMVSVYAQTQEAVQNVQTAAGAAGVPGASSSDLFTIIGRIINIFLGVIGTVLLFYLIYAGYLWMSSGGDAKGIERAKVMIRNAIIGIVIIASAFAIANFILSRLEGVSSGGGSVSGSGVSNLGFPSAGGSLGGGIIEYHLPPRDARDVARNTPVIITFKEPIKLSSLIQGYDDHGTSGDLTDDTTSTKPNLTTFKMYPTGQPERALTADDIGVRFTADRKTFVFFQRHCIPTNPSGCLGSATVNVGYTVEFGTNLQREDGQPAFSAAFGNGYKWLFEVSTKVDLTPPQVTSVIPVAGGQYAPNIVVQVNFSEAVDPTGASGLFKNGGGFTNMQVSAAHPGEPATRPNGEFKISNAYTTVEFVTDLACGTNTCGRTIFCLPASSAISVLVKAATLSDTPPQALFSDSGYDGITDVVGNSLDGNANGQAEGPTVDQYAWSFGTSDRPNLDPPAIKSTQPRAGDPGAWTITGGSSQVPVDLPPQMDFDSVLQASTLTTDSATILNNEPQELTDTFWWTVKQVLLTVDGKVVANKDDAPSGGRVQIAHRVYVSASSSTFPEYDPAVFSEVQNVYQNCFNPAASKTCTGPTCCDDRAANGACRYPVFPFTP